MIASKTLYVDNTGKIVEEVGRIPARLICRQGMQIPEDVIRRFKLEKIFGSGKASDAKHPSDSSDPAEREGRALSGKSISKRAE